ncbi:MAG: response regulator [Elusimicrobia bacterium]|nr:response regulator [Elusimicrobiota bacterium]
MGKLIIVDDSEILRSMIRGVLERAAIPIAGEAANSDETLALFEREKPDIVLLDILLPGESGIEILKKLKAKNPAVKVLIVTAINQDAINAQLEQLGAKGVLYKPFTPEELLSAVKKLM